MKNKARYLVHITIEERELLLAHMDPSEKDVVDALYRAHVAGPLVSLDLSQSDLEQFMLQLESVARHAQSVSAQERIGAALARIDAGFRRQTDPGAHLLRPAAAAHQYTHKQGQYLAFIYAYATLHRRAPSEADIQRYFGTTPPSVHAMLKTLQRKGFIARTAGVARSIRLLLKPHEIPALE